MALAEIGGAGVTALSLAAVGLGGGAAHAREALARRALARGERPAAPARAPAPAHVSARVSATAQISAPAPPAGPPAGQPGPVRASGQDR